MALVSADSHRHHDPGMLSVEEALERILGHFQALEPEEKPILDAQGQTLAENVTSSLDVPPWPNSAMDGYAVRAQDVAHAGPESPVVLNVIGTVAAGQSPRGSVGPGTAIRIMTGAPVPPGANAVVPFEQTDEIQRRVEGRGLDHIGVLTAAPAGANVRPAGEDIRRGEVALRRGAVLRPAEIGVLAALGRRTVRVVRRPVVGVLSTGDELLRPGRPLKAGKIYDANSYSVAAAVARYGGIPKPLGIARDNLPDLHRKLDHALAADMLITSAGVSKGDYDIVKEALVQRGRVSFWSVRMRPGKPVAFGTLAAPDGRQVPHMGLPGNPVSALVVFELFSRPAILKMLGRISWEKPSVEAALEGPIRNSDGRRVYARVQVTRRDGRYHAQPAGPQGSNILTSLARCNGLAICPEEVPHLEAGQPVRVLMLDWPEEVQGYCG
ncbi:MAG: molybdopterin molybdotransferase MoeA [Chloroflexi bacterium]|nr:molybdopterin molybdotransferase MoeA [Chloroflexota bacterium]